MKALISIVPSNSFFSFENMNYLTEKDIKSFKNFFFDRSIDYGENDKITFKIYPNRASSIIKQEFKSIEVLLKFLNTISKNLVKDCVDIQILNSVLKDTDFMYLWRDKIWEQIAFYHCLFQNTKKIFKNWNLN